MASADTLLTNSQNFAPASLLHRHDEILHDIVLPRGRVLAHVEGEDLLAVHAGRVFHPAGPHVFADELLELRRGNFAQPFEARDLRLAAEFRRRGIALGFVLAINRLLLVAGEVPHVERLALEREDGLRVQVAGGRSNFTGYC